MCVEVCFFVGLLFLSVLRASMHVFRVLGGT